MSNKLTVIHESDKSSSTPNPVDLRLGQWYWVKSICQFDDHPEGRKEGEEYEWLACVMQVGSNFAELHAPHGGQGYATIRVHFDDFWETLRFEPNSQAVIGERIAYYSQENARLMNEIEKVTSRLGLTPAAALAAPQASADESRALVTLSDQVDIHSYQRALVVAKEQTLPDLFEQMKEAHQHLTTWMQASSMSMKALMGPMKDSIKEIDDRIFSVSLYAGLTEEAVKCCDGQPADINEKLHVMQRRLYMDEECLLDYQAGGMEFKDIELFDAWLTKPSNRDRILPFPRTMVAMQVRRKQKEREGGSLLRAFINVQLGLSDTLTFLYIRNGEQVWRISCDMDFGEMLFPDKTMFDAQEPKMVKMFINRVDKMMSVSEFEQRKAEYEENEAKSEQWQKDNPDEHWMHNPHRHHGTFNPSDWHPFDQSSVYFDECMEEVAERIKEYNRVALIIQGLFDRSETLNPHPKVRSWTAEGFASAITLVYDGSSILPYGEAPDFEAYRARCNALLSADSVVTGQDDYWQRHEAERECRRLEKVMRGRGNYDKPKRLKPDGNPGPGVVAHMAHWKARSREAVFAWNRERQYDVAYGPGRGEAIRTTLTVPDSELFNVSAYTPGDHMQFFRDPRTRAEYLKWAPLLLVAENFHAGKIEAQEPVAE
jgi:hypothetical protein